MIFLAVIRGLEDEIGSDTEQSEKQRETGRSGVAAAEVRSVHRKLDVVEDSEIGADDANYEMMTQ